MILGGELRVWKPRMKPPPWKSDSARRSSEVGAQGQSRGAIP